MNSAIISDQVIVDEAERINKIDKPFLHLSVGKINKANNMKNFTKFALTIAIVAAVGMGSYNAYESFFTKNMSEDDLLLSENVLALSEAFNGQGCKHYQTLGCSGDTRRFSCSEGGGPTCTINCGVKHEFMNCK